MYKFGEKSNETEQENIMIYTEDKKAIGVMPKKEYMRTEKINVGNSSISPWVECVTCFIIDKNTNEVAVQLRGMNEIDPGEFDLCSGHVSVGEINKTAMIREIKEEMLMKGYDRERLSRELIFCGNVKMDFSKAKNNKGKNLRCFTTAYAILIDDKEIVSANEPAILKVGWLGLEKLKNQIRNSNFRFPYTNENSSQYEKIFENVEKVIRRKTRPNKCY